MIIFFFFFSQWHIIIIHVGVLSLHEDFPCYDFMFFFPSVRRHKFHKFNHETFKMMATCIFDYRTNLLSHMLRLFLLLPNPCGSAQPKRCSEIPSKASPHQRSLFIFSKLENTWKCALWYIESFARCSNYQCNKDTLTIILRSLEN